MGLYMSNFKSLGWASAQTLFSIFSQIIIFIILSRILGPYHFGIYAILFSIVSILMIIAEMGVGQYIIREENIDNYSCRQKLGLVILSSSIIYMLTLFAAFIFLKFNDLYRSEIYAFIAMSAIIPLFSIKQISYSLLQREENHSCNAVAEIIALIFQVSVACAVSAVTQSYWALVYGVLTYHLTSTLLCYKFCPILPVFHNVYNSNMICFSKSYVTLKLLDLSTRTFSNLVLSFTTSVSNIGLYQRANNILNLGRSFSFLPNQIVLYPKISSSKNSDRFHYYKVLLRNNFLYSVPLTIIIVSISPAWVPFLFGKEWIDATPLIQILALSIPFTTLDASLDLLSKSLNCQKIMLYLKVPSTIVFLISMYFISQFSIVYTATSSVFIFSFISIISIIMAARLLKEKISLLLRYVCPFLGLYIFLLFAAFFSSSLLDNILHPLLNGLFIGCFFSFLYLYISITMSKLYHNDAEEIK